MSNANYESLGLNSTTTYVRGDVVKAWAKRSKAVHTNKGATSGANQDTLKKARNAILAKLQSGAPNNGRRKNVSGAVGSAVAHNVNEFFRRKNVVAIVPRKGNQPAVGLKPATNNSNPMAIVPFKNKPHEIVPIPAKIEKKLNAPRPAGVNAGTNARPVGVNAATNARPVGVNARPGAPPRRSFWNRFSLPSFSLPKFPTRRPPPVSWSGINQGFIPSATFKGRKPGYVFKTNQYGTGYYKNTIEYGPNQNGRPVPTKNNGVRAGNNGGGNNNGRGSGSGSGSGARVRAGNVRTGNTRLGNVKSTSGSSRVEGVRGGSSQSEGGRGGSISFAPVIKVNVPQAAAQSAVQALPAQERLALTNAGGYNNAAAAVSNAGGPATVERAINALNANGGNVNAAMQKTGLPRQVFNNVNKLGGPVTARRTLTAVKKVTVKTAPYVGQNATQRVAPNVYALAPAKKHRKKRMEVKLSELNRVINAVKKKKLTSLVAHNVTRTNIHANNGRLKSYYKRVIKAAILKTPFAKIARGHAKKLVVSPRVRKPRAKSVQSNVAPPRYQNEAYYA
jgi:hypothetical protein